MVVPEHTRNALFSLFVGLRAENSPKDADFFKIHAEALQPRSFLGWLVGLSTRCCLLFPNSQAAEDLMLDFMQHSNLHMDRR